MKASTRTLVAVLAGASLQLAAYTEAAAPVFRVPRPAPPAAPRPLDVAQRQIRALRWKPSSVSTGLPFHAGAKLRHAAQLPLEGAGFWTIRPERNTHYGTDDMVAGLIETCARLLESDPAMQPLAIGDLSGPRGGRVSLHLSHRSGRDADLLFFWTDAKGSPVLTEDFIRFDRTGRGRYLGKPVRFDVLRNWSLVRALMAGERFGERVSAIFVAPHLRRLLLEHGRRTEPDPAVLARVGRVLLNAREKDGAHDDHFHLRIRCSARERSLGCRD
ncbi:MAG: penicillin-insensitive murein endopeptidase [Elusimicrobia bacterium]|nr:penicillin-insensitive murein endopeptidase [Elusimicrobiota bacterium]